MQGRTPAGAGRAPHGRPHAPQHRRVTSRVTGNTPPTLGAVQTVPTARRLGWLVLAVVAVLTLGSPLRPPGPHHATIDLYLDGVHVTGDGRLEAVPAGIAAEYLPGTRVLASADRADAVAAEHQAWLAAGDVPGRGTEYEELVEGALLDLHALAGVANGGTEGAAVAAWSPRWRYVWPRDGAFVAAALATTGHTADARTVLKFLASVQEPDGSFHARYLPDGSGVPDERGLQTDGNGWVLWATAVLLEHLDGAERAAAAAELRPLVDRSVNHLLALTDRPSRLPPPSADYWEVSERALTLGTVAPLVAGLEAAAAVYADLDPGRARVLTERAGEVRAAMVARFAPIGYERYASGGPLSGLYRADGRDTATAFLLEPFTAAPVDGAEQAWLTSIEEMRRPAGGLAPGAGWKQDGISWTPTTTLYALAAAENGHPELARDVLDWVAAHRTGSGAIPEKVLADGSPAAVAPLAWSCANVVLAVAALEESGALGR